MEELHELLQTFRYGEARKLVTDMLADRVGAPRPQTSKTASDGRAPKARRIQPDDAAIEVARDDNYVRNRPYAMEDEFADDEIPPEFEQEFADQMAAMMAAAPTVDVKPPPPSKG
jgi:hypothetical protein